MKETLNNDKETMEFLNNRLNYYKEYINSFKNQSSSLWARGQILVEEYFTTENKTSFVK